MPSVDDVLRQAFDPVDDDWARRAPTARVVVMARHRRWQAVRRSVAVATSAAAAAAVVVLAPTDLRSSRTEPATPPPSPTISAMTTPLEGTWSSGLLRRSDVRAAARAAGTPDATASMLEELPGTPFRVVLSVTGATVRARVTSDRAEDVQLDAESLSVGASTLELRPFGASGRTVHAWEVIGARLTMDFRSTTEPATSGVPGEAWQRLLYDSAPFTR